MLAPATGAGYNSSMRIISRKALREFWDQHPDSRQLLQAWYDDVKQAKWHTPADIKNVYRNASFLADNRVVFNIKGNNYRLIVAVQYAHGILYIRFVGTHRDYDKIDATSI
jgi:mRNA interferase HigB